MPKASRPSVYEVRTTFRAPLPFVFRWCTDYRPDDPAREKEDFQRRILSRTARRVVYEDLSEMPDGWSWSRMTVTLRPPNRWHADAAGNRRTWSLDYVLGELADGRTSFHMRGERRATPLGPPNPPRSALEPELLRSWRNFARALERDYRASRRSRPKRRT